MTNEIKNSHFSVNVTVNFDFPVVVHLDITMSYIPAYLEVEDWYWIFLALSSLFSTALNITLCYFWRQQKNRKTIDSTFSIISADKYTYRKKKSVV